MVHGQVFRIVRKIANHMLQYAECVTAIAHGRT